jgi:serpin B
MKYKRMISAALCFSMAVSAAMAVPSVNAARYSMAEEVIDGDVNYDGAFNIADLVTFRKWIMNGSDYIRKEAADLNKDGKINAFDYALMRKMVAEKFFPDYVPMTARNLCNGVDKEEVEATAADKDFILAQTSFALDLMKRTSQDDENTLISPYSVMQALAMTANGAKGDTKAAMEKTLGGLSVDKLNGCLYSQHTTQPAESYCKLTTANSVWARDDAERLTVKEDFVQKMVNYYNADFYMAPFDETTLRDVNNWTSTHTDGMVPQILDEINEDHLLYLVNAVAFDAKWQKEYEASDVTEKEFTAFDGTKQKADMLCSTEDLYLSGENVTGVMKKYMGGKYAFAALLPDEGISVNDYIGSLTPEKLYDMFSKPESVDVITQIPKFSYDFGTSMRDTLINMGMGLAFSNLADFSDMAELKNGHPICIDDVIHKTHIELTESGTRAAAATIVMMKETGCVMPDPDRRVEEVILDRPFVYCIVDTENSLPVFIGTVMTLDK